MSAFPGQTAGHCSDVIASRRYRLGYFPPLSWLEPVSGHYASDDLREWEDDFYNVTVHRSRLDGVGASLLVNPTASCEIPTLGTVRTIREQARSYRHNWEPVNSYIALNLRYPALSCIILYYWVILCYVRFCDNDDNDRCNLCIVELFFF
jgi:hypothetical protein